MTYIHYNPGHDQRATEKQLAYVRKLASAASVKDTPLAVKVLEILDDPKTWMSKAYASNAIYELQQMQQQAAANRRGAVPATEKQVEFLGSLIEKTRAKTDDADILEFLRLCEEKRLDNLTKSIASTLIDTLINLRIPAKVVERTETPEAPKCNIPLGTYTVVLNGDETDYVTLRIEIDSFTGRKNTMVSYLSGSDNEFSYSGCAFINGNGVTMWKKFRDSERLRTAINALIAMHDENALGAAKEEFFKIAEAYALKSGHCMRCGRKLTVPASLHRGLGPHCAAAEGL